jgi:hypothetical protein
MLFYRCHKKDRLRNFFMALDLQYNNCELKKSQRLTGEGDRNYTSQKKIIKARRFIQSGQNKIN